MWNVTSVDFLSLFIQFTKTLYGNLIIMYGMHAYLNVSTYIMYEKCSMHGVHYTGACQLTFNFRKLTFGQLTKLTFSYRCGTAYVKTILLLFSP